MSTVTRVVKNTWYLYVRMLMTVVISLYSTRLILNALGAADFGIFNVIGGSIAMLGFLNSTLANATQRFMSYAEGKGDEASKRVIFNVSCVLHLIIAFCTVALLLGLTPLLFSDILNIDPARVHAAHIVYYCLIISTFLSIINVPYEALLTAHENMLYYSVVGILESILRLGIAFFCVYYGGDRLVAYGLLMGLLPLLTLSIMKVYCHRRYEECVLNFRRYWDFGVVKRIASFSGWNFLTALSSLLTVQGLGVVLNHFFGSVANAAQGIANQVNGQLSSFSLNMMKALNPVIVKTTAGADVRSVNRVTLSGCKVSTLLIILFAVPVILEMPYILRLWLKNVPQWAVLFCRLQLVYTIISQMANPAATAVYGQGDIKYYAIWKSIMNTLPLLLTYLCFRLGGNPVWLYIPLIIFMGVGGDFVIIRYAHRLCGISVKDFIQKVAVPVCGICLLMTVAGVPVIALRGEDLLRLLICCALTTIALFGGVLLFGLDDYERDGLREVWKRVMRRR